MHNNRKIIVKWFKSRKWTIEKGTTHIKIRTKKTSNDKVCVKHFCIQTHTHTVSYTTAVNG